MAEYTKLNLSNGDTLTAEHLAHIEEGIVAAGENQTVVDSAFSSTSTNPVQNKVVNEAISNLNTLVGETAVSAQIATAIADTAEKEHTHAVSDVTDLQEQLNAKVPTSRTVNGKALSADIALKVSELENDAGYITGYTETDPTVPAWAKAELKPTYTAQEVGALPDTTVIPSIVGLATETYVDNAVDEIDVLTDAEIAEICGSTVGNLTLIDQDAIAEQVVDTLMEELPTNQELIDNVAEKVPIVKVAEQPTFVDSVDEMTDTSKVYVLSSTGMIWAYGKAGKQPAFTDLTKQDGWTWTENSRTNSSGTFTEDTGTYASDYIPCKLDDIVSVCALNLRTSLSNAMSVQFFNNSKTFLFTGGSVNLKPAGIITVNGELITIQGGKTSDDGSTVIDNANIAYIRICGIPFDGYTIYDVIITVNEEIAYTEGYAWYDTGVVYNQPADYEDRVITLETTAANHSADINVLKQQIADIGNGASATTIPEWWEDEVADTIAKIKALQVGRNCVTFPFFSDNHQRNGHAGVLIARIMNECNIPYCFYGGDSISSGIIIDEAEMIAQDEAFDAAMSYIPNGRFCRVVGNHDGYWYDGANKFYYSREQVYELFLREESIAQNKHFGDDGTYYYIDDVASKVRWIMLNFNGYDDAQLAWLDTALTFPESGWSVVFIAHAPITSHYLSYNVKDATVREKIKAYINGTSANKADVIGWFAGHVHRDRIFEGVASNPGYGGNTDPETDAAEGNPIGEVLPWKTVTIISDNVAIGYGGIKHAIDNSDQSHAIDFVTINKNTRTVNLTRLGFGDDRSFTY